MKPISLALIVLPFAAMATEPLTLTGPGDSHVFENLRCSEIDTSLIYVGDREFDPSRDRVAIYGNGSIVIADGWTDPLTIYNEAGMKGDNMVLQHDCYYRSELQADESFLPEYELGKFDNNIRSFKLKRGFSCTMANNPDGTGYSRVFIADTGDMVVDVMPEGLDFVSFVRVCRFDWTGKRGVSGGDIVGLSGASWFYDWGAGAESCSDYEYVPMRHNRWWDGWDNINSRTAANSVLGFNEPDHADQSDLGTEIAIEMWPEFMKSGLRIGSPAPDNINKQWLHEFLAKADSLNYRVDFVATHMYWNSQEPYALANTIADLCRNSYGGRPMWITEWNNGANWTNERWPDQSGPQRDAEFNIKLDESGKQVEVARPHTEANSAVQCAWLTKALDAFDKCEWLERHAFYNWVEDARSIEIDGKLTPAGKIFKEFNSRPAFNRNTEYVHRWRIAPPRIIGIRYTNKRVRIDFYDHNGETAIGYVVERRIDGLPWQEIAVIEPGSDYKQGKETYFRDMDVSANGIYQYRFKALSYKGGESIYSRWATIRIANAGVGDVADDSVLSVSARNGRIMVEANSDGELPVYAIDGRMVGKISYTAGLSESVILPKGIYIVNCQKVIL